MISDFSLTAKAFTIFTIKLFEIDLFNFNTTLSMKVDHELFKNVFKIVPSLIV